MGTAAKPTREHRTITVDFQHEATYFQLLDDGKAFLEFVFAFLLALGFQLKHTATCRGGGCLTRHSHYVRVRLGGLTIWRIQCTRCKAAFTVLPHFVLRYRQIRPEVARDALLGFPDEMEKFCTLATLSWRPEWSEARTCVGFFDIEVLFAIDIDVGVPRGPDMGQITLLHGIAFLRQLFHHRCHRDRVPDDDRIGYQVETECLMG